MSPSVSVPSPDILSSTSKPQLRSTPSILPPLQMLHRVYFVYLPRRYIQFSLCFQMTFRAYRAVFSRAYGAIHQQPTMYAKSANDVRNSSQMQTGLVNLSFENHTKGRVYRFRKVRVWRLSLKFYLPPRFDKKWLFFVGRAAPDRLY